ncbi:sterol desaturase family protein [Actinomadura gamaensis]|uniref:Sterol desaturase family protein n=1 Tax=Actinomadura gamaensis TaxID=1763541 RepID=A0ABV9TQJ2_9ACTN
MSPRTDTPGWLRPGLTLTGAAREFFRHPSPKVLVPAAAAAITARLAAGRWTRRDAVVPAAVLAAEPFVEWIVHVTVLHWKPRTVRGRRIDPLLSRKHRAHHRDPRDAELVFVPMPVLPGVIAGLVALNLAIARDRRVALTGIATSLTALAGYEWTHFLIHSSYRPRHAPYRVAWRSHRLHHFRNERYWFGVVTPISDQVLGTYPAKDEVPPSPTAKTLGVEELRPA